MKKIHYRPRKAIFILFLMFLIPIVCICRLFISVIKQDNMKIALSLYSNSMLQNLHYIDSVWERANVLACSLSLEHDAQDFFSMRTLPAKYAEQKTIYHLYLRLQHYADLSEGLFSDIYVYNYHSKGYYSLGRRFPDTSAPYLTEGQWTDLLKTDITLLSHSELTEQFSGNANDVILVKSVIRNGTPLGIIALKLNLAMVDEFFHPSSDTHSFDIMLSSDDRANTVFASSLHNGDDLKAIATRAASSDHGRMTLDRQEYLYYSRPSTVMKGFSYWVIIPIRELEDSFTRHVTTYGLVMSLLVLFTILAASSLAGRGIYKPINRLKNRLHGQNVQKDRRMSFIENEIMDEMEKLIEDMHIQAETDSNLIADITAKNRELESSLNSKDNQLAGSAIQKLLNAETLSCDENMLLCHRMASSQYPGFCLAILRIENKLIPAGEIHRLFNALYEENNAGCWGIEYFCSSYEDHYFIVRLSDRQQLAQAETVLKALLGEAAHTLADHGEKTRIVLGELVFETSVSLQAFAHGLHSAREKLYEQDTLPASLNVGSKKSEEGVFATLYEMYLRFSQFLKDGEITYAQNVVGDLCRFVEQDSSMIQSGRLVLHAMGSALLHDMIVSGAQQGLIDQLFERQKAGKHKYETRDIEQDYQFLIAILNQMSDTDKTIDTQNHASQVMSIIADEGLTDIRLQEIADRLGVSEAHLSRQFKATYGTNFKDYLIKLKLKKAKELLLSTPLSLKEICGEIGYEDSKSFSRIFRKYVGITPQQFRTMNANTPNSCGEDGE